MKMSRVLLGAAALALSVSGLGVSTAATVASSLTVQANVLGTCAFNSATYNMTFADYAPVLNSPSLTLPLSVTCSNTVPYSLGVTGLVGGKRFMANGPDNLEFNIFKDAAYTQVLGNTPLTDTFDAVGTGLAQSYTLYGKIPDNAGNRAVPSGAYTVTLAIDITY
jgi:spore coat protein U-like protein